MTEQENSPLLSMLTDALQRMDQDASPSSDGFSDMAIMLAAYFVGADEKKIAVELGFDREFVDLVGNRLRTAGIWTGDKIDHRAASRWEGEHGAVAFFCDANVARGVFVISKYDRGEPAYVLSDSGRSHAEKLLGDSK